MKYFIFLLMGCVLYSGKFESLAESNQKIFITKLKEYISNVDISEQPSCSIMHGVTELGIIIKADGNIQRQVSIKKIETLCFFRDYVLTVDQRQQSLARSKIKEAYKLLLDRYNKSVQKG